MRTIPIISALVLLSSCFGSGSEKPVFTEQDRNGQCWTTEDCLEGLHCENATKDVPGTCTFVCQSDSDCGNGFLCRMGACQADCAGLNEKCSDRRICCFYDDNGDGRSDSDCLPDESGGDVRCRLTLTEEEEEEELEEAEEGGLEEAEEAEGLEAKERGEEEEDEVMPPPSSAADLPLAEQ